MEKGVPGVMSSNSFTSFEEALNTMEAYYQQFMQGDLTPEDESETRVLLLGLFSTLKAHASRMENNKTFISSLEDVRENVIAWNALGPWFREVKPLVDGIYILITLGKELLLITIPKPVVESDEIDSLRTELREVKDTVKSLIHALKASTRIITQPSDKEGPSITDPPSKTQKDSEEDQKVDSGPISEIDDPSSQQLTVVAADGHDKMAEDSFMELISLEAKKYAVEKAITTLESEFYEGRHSRDSFEQSISTQKQELAQILTQINSLRDELEASS